MVTKRLYRSRKERMLAGVCGGLAEYFDIDPTIVRLAFVLLALAGGPGIVVYIIMAIVVPEAPVGAYGTRSAAPASPAVDVEAKEVVHEDEEVTSAEE